MENIYHVAVNNEPLYLEDAHGQIFKDAHEAEKFIKEWTTKGFLLIGTWTVNYSENPKEPDSRIHILMGLVRE